jgi:hypothetical protein
MNRFLHSTKIQFFLCALRTSANDHFTFSPRGWKLNLPLSRGCSGSRGALGEG